MGKKTDKFIDAITSAGKKYRSQMDDYVLKMQQIDTLTDKQIEAIKAFGPVWKLHMAKYDNNEDEAKKFWDTDQDVKEKYLAMLNAEKKSVSAIGEVNDIRNSIEGGLKYIQSSLEDFASFIKEKKKKQTFKSKKSLPLAEEFIQDHGLILENLQRYFTGLKRRFEV